MSTKAGTGAGAVLSMSTSSSGTYTPIAQVKTFQFSGQKWSYADITNAGSPSVGEGLQNEYQPTLTNPGEIAIAGIVLPSDAGQQLLETAFASTTMYYFKLQLATQASLGQTTAGNLYAFSGYIEDNPLPDVQYDKELTFKCTVKLNSTITVTVGS